MLKTAQNFLRDDGASIATVFAFTLLALLASIGLAIDYSAAQDRRSKLDAAADAAVLAAVKAARDRFVEGRQDWETEGQRAGEAVFQQALQSVLGNNSELKKVMLVITRDGNEFEGALSYAAVYPTRIMKLFNTSELRVDNTMKASFAVANYLDVHLLIDASPSMGIGATLADQTTMQTAMNCALACHQDAGNWATFQTTGARTRIDIVRDATRKFIDDLRAQRLSADQVRISIHLFSNDIHELFASSTDLDAAYTAAANINLMDYPAFGSNSSYALQRLNSVIPHGGQGFRDNDRKSYVVLLSDGIEDSRYRPSVIDAESVDPNFTDTSPFYIAGFERLQSMERASCDPIKSNNHNMLTAHVEYLVPPAWDAAATPRFDFIRDNLIDKSIAEYEGCASKPSLAFNAAESADIEPMFGEILNAIMSATDLRLTN